MQENTDGKIKKQNKIPVHTNQLRPLNEYDLFKSVKIPLINILRSKDEIDDERLATQFEKHFFTKRKGIEMFQTNIQFDQILEETVCNTNKIVTNTCNFINSYVLYEFDMYKSITKITDSYIKLVMKTVSKRNTHGRESNNNIIKTKFDSFFETYFKKTMKDENYACDDKLSFALKYEAIDILKNIEVNITEHYIDHLYKFVNVYFNLKSKLVALNKIENKDKKNEMTRKMFSELDKIKRDLIQSQPNLDKLKYESLKMHHEWIKKVKKNIMPQKIFAKNSIHYDVCVNPQEYLGYMIWINKQLESASTKENPIKLFHVIPLRTSFIPKHITFDTSCLINIFNDKGGNGEMFKNVNNNKDRIWNRYFKMKTKHFIKKGYEFNDTIKTDGVSVSILFVKKGKKDKRGHVKQYTIAETKEISKKRDELENKYIEDVKNINKIFENKSYVCIDPNAGDLIHGIVGNFEENNKTTIKKRFKYTRNQRRKECKIKRYKEIRKELTSEKIEIDSKSDMATMITNIKQYKKPVNDASIINIQNTLSLFSSKTCNFKKFLEYVKHKNIVDILISDVYKKKIFRKLKMNTYTNTKKSESKMINSFKEKIGKPNKVVIIYGDYDDKGRHIKGKEPIVSKRLRRVFREVGYDEYLINEHNTSALCNICEHKTEKCLTRVSQKPKNKKKIVFEEVWGLRRCSNLNCKATTKKGIICPRLYNRDDNACMNMIKIVEYLKKYGKRPAMYCRPIKTEENGILKKNPKSC